MSTEVRSATSRLHKLIIVFALLVAASIATNVLETIDSSWGWVIPAVSACAVAYAFINPAWTLLGFSSLGIVKVFGVIAFVSVIVAGSASIEATQKQQLKAAQLIVEVGKADPKAQIALLASADDGTLEALKGIAPALETGERGRRELIKKDEIAVVVAHAEQLPRDDLDGRIAAYKQLVGLAPNQTAFQEQLTFLETKRDKKLELLEHPEKGLQLVHFSWERGGFDSVMLLDATVKNTSNVPLKDFTIKCIHSAPSGTVIDTNEKEVFEKVVPGKTRRLRSINMGFIQSQVSRSFCEIKGAVVVN